MSELEKHRTPSKSSDSAGSFDSSGAVDFIDGLLRIRALDFAARLGSAGTSVIASPASPAATAVKPAAAIVPSASYKAAASTTHLVVLIEDEAHIRHAVRTALGDVPIRLEEAATGAAGVEATLTQRPDLVVLDLGLPDLDGLEVCRQIRAQSAVPIIVLSARHAEHEKVALLNAGVDDYVTKPFSVLEFAARVNAQIRRSKQLAAIEDEITPLTIGGLTIDTAERKARRDGVQVHLTPIEWSILATLIGALGRTLTHQQIFDAVWGRQFGNPQQYLRVHITNLRRKIEIRPAEPQIVITEPGVGYRVDVP